MQGELEADAIKHDLDSVGSPCSGYDPATSSFPSSNPRSGSNVSPMACIRRAIAQTDRSTHTLAAGSKLDRGFPAFGDFCVTKNIKYYVSLGTTHFIFFHCTKKDAAAHRIRNNVIIETEGQFHD